MASKADSDNSDEFVTLSCTVFDGSENENSDANQIVISTADVSSWDFQSILSRKVLKIKANPNRLIEKSSYFCGLLRGSFCESRMEYISIHWDAELFLIVLRFIFGCEVDITSDNFIPMYEAALFFGVETLLLKCHVWLNELTSFKGLQSPELGLYDLVHIWNYGLEHANDFILQHSTSYLARNFMWASSCNSFNDIPYELLCSVIKDPELTVDSEKHLCEAILVWLDANIAQSEGWSGEEASHADVLKQIRPSLLPLWFVAGTRKSCFFSKFADKGIGSILSLTRHLSTISMDVFKDADLSHLRIRFTKYTKRVDLSSCPQFTPSLLLLSMLPPSCYADPMLRKSIKDSSINHVRLKEDVFHVSRALGLMLAFNEVEEVDISNCPMLHLEAAIDCFCKSLPSLRKLRAAYSLDFKTKMLCQLVQKCPLLTEIDLTVDVTPVIPGQVSVVSSWPALPQRSTTYFDLGNCHSAAPFSYMSRPFLSNITKLTLEGRTDIRDSDLHDISEFCASLCYLNIKGCISVTDNGISVIILKCKRLHSVLVCDTSFGNNSVLALCYGISGVEPQSENHSHTMASKCQTLHIGGCNGINETALSELLSGANNLRSLCLREIQLIDSALYCFSGSSLEMLDVSDTKVSAAALAHVIHRNLDLKCLKARGCRHLLLNESKTEERNLPAFLHTPKELYSELGESCKLEEIQLGWGFSFLYMEALKPAFRTLRTVVVGLGGSLGQEGLKQLPDICPLLETLILYFQVISDSAIMHVMKTLLQLQVLALCYCIGEISSLSFKFMMPNLRNLKLERLTPWMTNEDLVNLTQNCPKLVELSLTGCTLLNSESQDIISSGWPGLMSIHLEDCGEVTTNDVVSLLDCHALEDLMLRHTGPGITRNFIIYAAYKLPMLRKISLDRCDARDGDFDIPNCDDRYFLSSVKIARCKLQPCTFDLHNLEGRRTPMHKETLILAWNSEKLTRIVVKERL
ncbi:ubiquitin-protein ligase [Forsythia ovata]|uniref:Ubiquitin-protein ligase n=1 Tax=Forsythia ovata TaxID=205694 RepID=A0ABD1T911_9LAMI